MSRRTNLARRTLCVLAAAVASTSTAARGLDINLEYSSSITSLPNAGQVESAVDYAAQQLELAYSNPITVNFAIDASTSTAYLGETVAVQNGTSYSSLQQAYVGHADSDGDIGQQNAAMYNWPEEDPTETSNDNWFVPSAEAKALGMEGANNNIDATVTFSFAFAYTYDPFDRTVPGEYDFIGAAEHELAHALGRDALIGTAANNGQPSYDPLDLYRFIAPGDLSDSTTENVYYSADDGLSVGKFFATAGDTSDWGNPPPNALSTGNDSFDAFLGAGATNGLTSADITEMEDLGYDVTPTLLTWNDGTGGFLSSNGWSSSSQQGINPHHGSVLILNSGEATCNLNAGQNMTLASNYDLGVELFVEDSATFNIAVSGTLGASGYGLDIDQDGALFAENFSNVNIAGPMSVGNDTGVTNAAAYFSGDSEVKIGTVTNAGGVLYVGYYGVGSVTQSGASVVDAPVLDMGATLFGNGNYTLSDTAQMSVSEQEIIGYQGPAEFTQTGGTNLDFGTLFIAQLSTSTSQYSLSAGTLTSIASQTIGQYGLGTFEQTGGADIANTTVNLGTETGGYGAYYLSDPGTLDLNDDMNVGEFGTGFFEQMGGICSIGGSLNLASFAGGTGSFSISSGTATVGGSAWVGGSSGSAGGFGQLYIYDGTMTIANGLTVYNTKDSLIGLFGGQLTCGSLNDAGKFDLFEWTAGTLQLTDQNLDFISATDPFNSNPLGGTITLNSSQTLEVTETEWLLGSASVVTQDPGSSNTCADIEVGGINGNGTATYVLTGGTLSSNGSYIGYTSSGEGGPGMFNQSGGTNTVSTVYVAYNQAGTYNLSGGTLASVNIMLANSGTFNQTGGILTFNTFSQSGGTLNVNEPIVPYGSTYIPSGNFDQTGGTANFGTNLTLDNTDYICAGGSVNITGNSYSPFGTLTVDNTSLSEFYLSGGTLTVGNVNLGNNPSLFDWFSGTLHLTDQELDFTNQTDPLGDAEFGNSLTLDSLQALEVDSSEFLWGANATINQTGGSNNTSGLFIGNATGAGKPAAYVLSGGSLVADLNEYIGYVGTFGPTGNGVFNQSGGTNTTPVFYLGYNDGGQGTYNLSGGTLTVNGTEYIQYGAPGTLNQTGGINDAKSTVNQGTINQTAGTSSLGPVTGSGNITLGASTGSVAVMTVAALQQNDVDILATGNLTLTGGTANAVNLLTIDNSAGVLNLTSAELIVNYGSGADPLSSIRSYLSSGYDSGTWTGPGINSSTVAALEATQALLVYSIGYADGIDGIVAGLSSGEIEILPTLAGDCKLQGTVNFGDFQLLAQYFNKAGGWDEGNFNYNAKINFGDFQLLAQDLGSNSSGLTAAELASMDTFAAQFGDTLVANPGGVGFQIVSVPEPATIGLLGAASLLIVRRRISDRRAARYP